MGTDLLDRSPIHFTLSNAADDLTLDDFSSISSLEPGWTGSGDKIVTLAPAAPDAKNDEFKTDIFEDGAAGLNNPSKTPTAIVFDVLKYDTDADHLDQLVITGFHDGPSHGTVRIADGVISLHPDLDYSGTDSFGTACLTARATKTAQWSRLNFGGRRCSHHRSRGHFECQRL